MRKRKNPLMQRAILAAVLPILVALSLPRSVGAESALNGTVVDRETNKPVPYVTVILDSAMVRASAEDGAFDFGLVADGSHFITFDHVSYQHRVMEINWSSGKVPLIVELVPSQFLLKEIVVSGEWLPIGSTSFSRRESSAAPGNIANDPLRTVQNQPSCAAQGIDFLSSMAVRGGDTDEHRVYFDGYPLDHYAHVGGFSAVVYDEMLESTVLVPGAAPIQYKGSLSGTVLMKPASPDTSFLSFRYDITSMAGGIGRSVSPAISFQASAKTSFFSLPVYQDIGVEKRSFRDFLGRVILSPEAPVTLTTTFLAATDSETGSAIGGVQPERDVRSLLAGVQLSCRLSGWEVGLRPSYSLYDSRDALSWREQARTHKLKDARLYAEAVRRGPVLGLGFYGEAGMICHSGTGGERRDSPVSASAQFGLTHGDLASLVLAIGGSREPWTSNFEAEAYGSVQVDLVDLAKISAAYRRSHQSPFRFSERLYFASLPIDAGDLLSSYKPSWEEAPAVRMDQASVGAVVTLPYRCTFELTGFRRWYRNLLTWEWKEFPDFDNVGSNGTGRGFGYEMVLARNAPGFVTVMVAAARARAWKKEGTLLEERVGDFDRPRSWQVSLSAKLSNHARLSLHFMDVYGRPYTPYESPTYPPTTDKVNSERLPDFRRLDIKFVYELLHESSEAEFFLDVLNVLNRRNIVMMPALEVSPGEFVSIYYGGTTFFPIGGVTIRW